jgi:hypothetical protein
MLARYRRAGMPLDVRVWVTFTPRGGDARSLASMVTLGKRRR